MGINIDALPDANLNPNQTIKPGFYKFEIVKAEMSQPKDTSKKPNMVMQFALTDAEGKKAGMLFERMYDSEADAFRYKYARFFRATEITGLSGTVDLKDLVKIVPGRKGVCEIIHEQDSRFPDDKTKVQAKVPLFGSECFWKLDQFEELINPESVFAQDELPFNVDDLPAFDPAAEAPAEKPAETTAPAPVEPETKADNY
jgi:hypothetical protein